MALAHLHKQMKDFLCNYAENTLQDKFFLDGMLGLIGQIDTFVRDNGSYSCSDARVMKIHERFLESKPVEGEYRCGYCTEALFPPSVFVGEVTRDGQLCKVDLCTNCANIFREEGANIRDQNIIEITVGLERMFKKRKDRTFGSTMSYNHSTQNMSRKES